MNDPHHSSSTLGLDVIFSVKPPSKLAPHPPPLTSPKPSAHTFQLMLNLAAQLSCSHHWDINIQSIGTCVCLLSHSVMSNFLRPRGLSPTRLLCLWDSPGKNTGVGCHVLLQEDFPTLGSNLGLLHCRQILYHLCHQGSPSRNLVLFISSLEPKNLSRSLKHLLIIKLINAHIKLKRC